MEASKSLGKKVKKPGKLLRRAAVGALALGVLSGEEYGRYSYGGWPWVEKNTYPESFERELVESNHGWGTESYYGIEITGRENDIERTRSALDLLLEKDSEGFKLVVNNLSRVTYVKEGQVSWKRGGGVDIGNGRFWIKKWAYESRKKLGDGREVGTNALEPTKIGSLASQLVHDASHVDFYRKGEVCAGYFGEVKCEKRQKETLDKIGMGWFEPSKFREWVFDPGLF